jgi:hypothetical protein
MIMNYELIGTIIAISGLAFGMWKIQHDSNIANHNREVSQGKEMQMITDKVMANEQNIAQMREQFRKEIDLNCETYRLELENVKRARAENVANAMARIERVEKMRETDVKELSGSIKESMKEATAIEEKHHNEVMDEIKTLTVQLTDMCSTFKEYRRTRNGNGNKKGDDIT